MQDKEAFLYVGPCDLPQSVPNFTHGIKIGCWSMDIYRSLLSTIRSPPSSMSCKHLEAKLSIEVAETST